MLRIRPWPALAALAAALAPLALLGVFAILAVAAWPAVAAGGARFLTGAVWNPGGISGALTLVAGTALTALGALVLAVPVGIGVAICLAERARGRIARALGFCVEMIAGVPGVVFGLWGFVAVVPWLEHRGGPALARVLGFIPFFRGPVGSGQGVLAASVVLAAMIVPLVAAVARDALLRVPAAVRDQGRALGLTDWELLRDLVLPRAAPGIVGGVLLALGRALGETMAVLMVSGSGPLLPGTAWTPTTTMASALIVDLRAAGAGGMAYHVLAELALLLLLVAVAVHLAVALVGGGVSRVASLLRPGWGGGPS